MTDSLKLAEMQRTNIELERQRHLANWFIKSSPHMAKPSSTSLNLNGGTKNGTINGPAAPSNPLFFVVSAGQIKHHPYNHHNHSSIPSSGIGIQTNPNGGSTALTSAGTVSINGGNKSALSRSQVIQSSQQPDNFPLQIVTTASSQVEGGVNGRSKTKLRRFNSHDTSANMFSVADFENARLARRNEIEMKQRQQHQRLKMNSLSSGGDCSTGDSKGSKNSNESQSEPLSAEIFLDRYSLPRVVRISYKQKFCANETLQSSSSNGSSNATTTTTATSTTTQSIGSSSTTSSSNNNNNNNNNNNHKGDKQNGGELFLLYRHLRQRYVYHGFNTKTNIANRKKGVIIPQEFPGFFSLINEKGLPTATQYTSLVQLVRERVHKFVSVDNLPAFIESQSTTNISSIDGFIATPTPTSNSSGSNRPQYIKSTARGGQVFRLLAVFEDGNQQQESKFSSSLIGGISSKNNSSNNGCSDSINGSSSNSGGREKEKGRYAQLFNENRQILYVPLTAKGKFYEIEPSIPSILQNQNGGGKQQQLPQHQRKLNPDCVHRISTLLTPDKEFPINLKFISSSNGGQVINHKDPSYSSSLLSSATIPENITITGMTKENCIIACPIGDDNSSLIISDSGQNINLSNLKLKKLSITNEMIFTKCLLGFESEQKMLSNTNVQNILKFCQFNCDHFIKKIEVELFRRPTERSTSKSRVDGLKKLKPISFPRLLRREKTTIAAHEKEDSIIFLSKNDLANLEAVQQQQKQQNTNNQLHGDQPQQQQQQQNQSNSSIFSDKMKVFQSTRKKWFKRSDKNQTNSMTCIDLDIQAKRMSMQRYSDMSKLLQERFGEEILAESNSPTKSNDNKPRPISDIGSISNTKSKNSNQNNQVNDSNNILQKNNGSTLQKRLQKSLSLQDMGSINNRRCNNQPDLVPTPSPSPNYNSNSITNNNNTETTTLAESMMSISSSTAPSTSNNQTTNILDESFKRKNFSNNNSNSSGDDECTNYGGNKVVDKHFISEKMYSEFHVKTKQYSKSSSSLHQLLHFAVPQKMNVCETKKSLTKLNGKNLGSNENHLNLRKDGDGSDQSESNKFNFLIGDPVSMNDEYSNTAIIDDLPYSSVRDSLLVSETTNIGVNGVGGDSYFHSNINSDSYNSIMITGTGLLNNNDFNYTNFGLINGSGGNTTAGNNESSGGTSSGGAKISNRNNNLIEIFDDARENIYAEICHSNLNSSNSYDDDDDYIDEDSYNRIKTAGAAISRIQISGNSNDINDSSDNNINKINITGTNNTTTTAAAAATKTTPRKNEDNEHELNYPEIIIKGASVVQATTSFYNNSSRTKQQPSQQQQEKQYLIGNNCNDSTSISIKYNKNLINSNNDEVLGISNSAGGSSSSSGVGSIIKSASSGITNCEIIGCVSGDDSTDIEINTTTTTSTINDDGDDGANIDNIYNTLK